MYRSSRLAICSVVLLLAACMKKEAPRDTTAAMAPAPAPAAAHQRRPSHSPAWPASGRSRPRRSVGKDTSSTTTTLDATADTTGWALELPSGQKVPLQVKVSADTVMTKSAVYPSMRRKGKKVWTEGAFRLENGKLTGSTVAHYENSGADSVLTLRTEATKLP